MNWNLENKTFLITGVANKKSIAYAVAQDLLECGAKILLSVQNEDIKKKVTELFPNIPLYICDVAQEDSIKKLGQTLEQEKKTLDGFIHCLAFANLQGKPYHETTSSDFMQATQISCFSFTSLSHALKNVLTKNASVVTLSISNTRATAYGFLGPIKAALDASVAYLAKSFSSFSEVRFNAVGAGPLKTMASAGIPNYLENYLFAEKLTLRKRNLETAEVAHTVLFLLSPLSSGINASTITVDAGMSCNYFDEDVVKTSL